MAVKPNYTITEAKKDIDALKAEVFGAGVGKPTIMDVIVRLDVYIAEQDNHNDIAAAVLGIGNKIMKSYKLISERQAKIEGMLNELLAVKPLV